MIYFGFALSDSMFADTCVIKKSVITMEQIKEMARHNQLVPCLNPSHIATINAMHNKYDFHIAIPDTPPKVSLGIGDKVIVMGVRNLPRLTDRHEYTQEEINNAEFKFSIYEVLE